MAQDKETQELHGRPIAAKKALDGLVFRTHTEYECTSPTGEKQFQIFTEEAGKTIPHSPTDEPRLENWKGTPMKVLGGSNDHTS